MRAKDEHLCRRAWPGPGEGGEAALDSRCTHSRCRSLAIQGKKSLDSIGLWMGVLEASLEARSWKGGRKIRNASVFYSPGAESGT